MVNNTVTHLFTDTYLHATNRDLCLCSTTLHIKRKIHPFSLWIYKIIWGDRKNNNPLWEGRQKLVHASVQQTSPSSIAGELNGNRNIESQNNLGWDGHLEVI